jgi:hypothetical protein
VARWLAAAAEVVADVCEMNPTDVVVEADNIEALPHESPTEILRLVELGTTPEAAVLGMVHGAMRAADGEIPDLEELLTRLTEATDQADQYGQGDPELLAELLPSRLTPLDASRPARDLLEDLLSAIHGCFLLYREARAIDDTDHSDPDVELSEEQLQAAAIRDRAAFITAVRARVAECQDQ